MPESASTSVAGLFDALGRGDARAKHELFRRFYDRLVRLAAKMLGDFPPVRARREAESVAHDLVVKLDGVLDDPTLRLDGEAGFFRLAACKLRQLLLDEVRKIRGRGEGNRPAALDPGTDTHNPADLEILSEFHRAIEALPAETRTVFEMHFFLELPQAEIARLLGWEPKQVSRKWLAACVKLAPYLPGE